MKPIKGRTYRLKNGEQILVGVYAGQVDVGGNCYKFFVFDEQTEYSYFMENEIIEEIDPKRRQRIHGKDRRPKNGDFSEYQVRCMVASYCRDITVGMTGWGVPFTAWVELKGLAKFVKGSLYKLEKPTCECEMCDGRRAAHEELEECLDNLQVGDRVKAINPDNTVSFGKEGVVLGIDELGKIRSGKINVNFDNGWSGWYDEADLEKLK